MLYKICPECLTMNVKNKWTCESCGRDISDVKQEYKESAEPSFERRYKSSPSADSEHQPVPQSNAHGINNENKAAEFNYYNRNGVTVTNKRIILGTNTYMISKIQSVEMSKHRYMLAFLTGILSVIVTCPFVAIIIGGFLNGDFDLGMTFLGIILVIGTITLFWVSERDAKYSVNLSGASGYNVLLKTKNKTEIESIIRAINKSIVENT